MRETAHFGAGQRLIRHQSAIAESQASGLVKIFGDYLRSRQACRFVVEDDRRRGPGRHQQELPAPVPRLFSDQTGLDSHFPKHEADEAGMGAKWMMVKRDHETA